MYPVAGQVGEQGVVRLVWLLRERGDLDGMRALASTGDQDVGEQLARLMAEQGRSKEAERLLRFGLNPDESVASG